MFENISIFKIANAMAVHAGQKQALISQNVANADTPGYMARDLPDFKSLYRPDDAQVQRATRADHLNGAVAGAGMATPVDRPGTASPDGNTVSVEEEMLSAVDAGRQHERALAIYKSALNVLHATLARS